MRDADDRQAAGAHAARRLTYYWDEQGMLVVHARLPAEQGAVVAKALEAAAAALAADQHAEDGRPPSAPASPGHTAPEASAETPSHAAPDASTETPSQAAPDVSAEAPAGGGAGRALRGDPWRPPWIDGSATDGRDAADPWAVRNVVDPWTARNADALVLLADSLLSHGVPDPAADRYQVLVHVDADTLRQHDRTRSGLCGIAGGPALPAHGARRLACDAAIVGLVHDRAGTPLDVGRKTRRIHPMVRRALHARDRGCVFPACPARRVEAHHIRHWADGGPTALDNLVHLCGFHHRLVHEGGFAITHSGSGRFHFRRPDGVWMPEATPGRDGDTDRLLDASGRRGLRNTADTGASRWQGDRLDLDFALASWPGGSRPAHALEHDRG